MIADRLCAGRTWSVHVSDRHSWRTEAYLTIPVLPDEVAFVIPQVSDLSHWRMSGSCFSALYSATTWGSVTFTTVSGFSRCSICGRPAIRMQNVTTMRIRYFMAGNSTTGLSFCFYAIGEKQGVGWRRKNVTPPPSQET